MDLDKWALAAIDKAGKVIVKSAMNPVLWVIGLVTIPCFLLGAAIENTLTRVFFLGVGVLPVFVALGAFIYLMLRNPNALRSEEFVLRMRSLELLGDSKMSGAVDGLLSMSSNPPPPDDETPQLPV